MNTRSDLTFDSRFANNCVIVLDALHSSDMQTARSLEENLAPLKHPDGTAYCRIVKTPDRTTFLSALNSITNECKHGVRPIVHIEAHGDKVGGLEIGESRELLSWVALEDCLAKINKVTGNNLGVVLASCWGLYAISPLKIANPCPYYFLMGPDKQVNAGYLKDQMKLFYESLFGTGSLDAAMVHIQTEFKQFHSEQFFYRVFASHLRKACMGKGAERRVEKFLSETIERGAINNRENRRKLRTSAKSFVKPSREKFIRNAGLFLHGKIPVPYEQFLAFVRQSAAFSDHQGGTVRALQ